MDMATKGAAKNKGFSPILLLLSYRNGLMETGDSGVELRFFSVCFSRFFCLRAATGTTTMLCCTTPGLTATTGAVVYQV